MNIENIKLAHVLKEKSRKIKNHIMKSSLGEIEQAYYMLRIFKESIIVCPKLAIFIDSLIEVCIDDISLKNPEIGIKLYKEYSNTVNRDEDLKTEIYDILLEPEFYNIREEEAKEMTMECFDYLMKMRRTHND